MYPKGRKVIPSIVDKQNIPRSLNVPSFSFLHFRLRNSSRGVRRKFVPSQVHTYTDRVSNRGPDSCVLRFLPIGEDENCLHDFDGFAPSAEDVGEEVL